MAGRSRAAAYGRIFDSAERPRSSGSAASLLRRSDAAAGVPSIINVDDEDDDNVSDQEDAEVDAASERSYTSDTMEECAQPAAAGRLFRSWADITAQHDFDDSDEAEEGARQQEQESRGDESQERQEADLDRPLFPPCNDPIFPQQARLTGLRGQKITLERLFGLHLTLQEL
ncbi:hypothetical protein PsorP6_015514 [Peronosclerospora sorghi]|uniref:Uncharacterized protein n=1 Tax=Peronosclerospora sorghi TaxID=230839 RepID=A0ACC0WPQ6_9STRA|nr:hypothetical protein PsorP6_015514 [Peronosclerospora sorghi]